MREGGKERKMLKKRRGYRKRKERKGHKNRRKDGNKEMREEDGFNGKGGERRRKNEDHLLYEDK